MCPRESLGCGSRHDSLEQINQHLTLLSGQRSSRLRGAESDKCRFVPNLSWTSLTEKIWGRMSRVFSPVPALSLPFNLPAEPVVLSRRVMLTLTPEIFVIRKNTSE